MYISVTVPLRFPGAAKSAVSAMIAGMAPPRPSPEGAQQRCDACEQQRQDEHRLAAESIAERPHREPADHRPAVARGEHTADLGMCQAPVLRKERRDERDHQRIVAVHHGDEECLRRNAFRCGARRHWCARHFRSLPRINRLNLSQRRAPIQFNPP
jgi:hypothetical protein